MKLAATNPTEIIALIRFLNELNNFRKEHQPFNYEDLVIDEQDYPLISKSKKECDEMGINTMGELLINVLEHLDNIHYLRILWNCDTLFKNCADQTSDTLEFSKDLQEAMEKAEKYDKLISSTSQIKND